MPNVNYVMKISRLTVDKLGVRLYDKVSAVIAELVSNAYDADATRVTVEAPMGEFLASKSGGKVIDKGWSITVTDNGIGMSPQEVQDFFLIVGSERRKDQKRGDTSKKYGRKVMGRKGVGKLAPFGICDVIEVISAGGKRVRKKGFPTAHIVLEKNKILQDTEFDYQPNVGSKDNTFSPQSGTTIKLSGFNYRKVPDIDDFARQLAQRFGLSGSTWKVTLIDSLKTSSARDHKRAVGAFDVTTMPNTRINLTGPEPTLASPSGSKYKAIAPNGDVVSDFSAGFEHEGRFYPVVGWIGYAKDPYKDDLMAGVRIYCRGKFATQTSVFNRRAGFTGEHNVRSYLVGEFHADWLDEAEDLIQTDRRDILWSHELGTAFQAWGQKVVLRIGTLARDPMRDTIWQRFLLTSKLEKKAESAYPGTDQKQIREATIEIAKMFGRTMRGDEVEDPDAVSALVDIAIMLAPHVMLDRRLREAADTSKTPLHLVGSILKTARLAELASFGRIADNRLSVIDRLKVLKDAVGMTEDKLQGLIESAPWLINPQWAPVTANSSLTTLKKEFEKYYKKHTGNAINLTDFSDSTKRPDFVMSSQDNVLQIIEIKRPAHKLKNAEMDRIIVYKTQLENFLTDPANKDFRAIASGFRITLVCDEISLTGAQKLSFESMQSNAMLEHISWRSFLLRTEKMHKEFLDEAEKQRGYVSRKKSVV